MEENTPTSKGNEGTGGEIFQLEEITRTKSKSNFERDTADISMSKVQGSASHPLKLNEKQTQSDGDDEFSSSDESEIQYYPDKRVTRNSSTRNPNHKFSKEKRRKQEVTIGIGNGVADDNFGFPDPNSIKVTRTDVIFSMIVLLISIGEFVIDFALIWWHYADDLKWVSTFTAVFMIFGAAGLLNHFSHVDTDTLNRLFLNWKRVKLLTSCFPFLGSIISSYQCMLTALRARREQVFSLQYFGVEDFSLNLLRIQSFFQSAPQASLQLVVLMETVNEISFAKAAFSIVGVVLSLGIMTISNLPYRNQNSETMVIPAAYGVKKRLFIACRMFSSFGSRAMAIAYLFMGLRCILGPETTFVSILMGIVLIFLPRLIFTSADYVKQLRKARRSRNPEECQNISCCSTFVGYFATIFIPMSDPLWIFWYVWVETALYVLFGNIVGWSTNCITNLVNTLYSGTFIVVFIIIPILIPFATARRKQLKRMELFFDEKIGNDSPGISPTTSSNSNHDVPYL